MPRFNQDESYEDEPVFGGKRSRPWVEPAEDIARDQVSLAPAVDPRNILAGDVHVPRRVKIKFSPTPSGRVTGQHSNLPPHVLRRSNPAAPMSGMHPTFAGTANQLDPSESTHRHIGDAHNASHNRHNYGFPLNAQRPRAPVRMFGRRPGIRQPPNDDYVTARAKIGYYDPPEVQMRRHIDDQYDSVPGYDNLHEINNAFWPGDGIPTPSPSLSEDTVVGSGCYKMRKKKSSSNVFFEKGWSKGLSRRQKLDVYKQVGLPVAPSYKRRSPKGFNECRWRGGR